MNHLQELLRRYPVLEPLGPRIEETFHALERCYAAGGKLLVCGNGGSAADSDHVVGELMKGYLKPRPVAPEAAAALRAADPGLGPALADHLQGALPAINLAAGSALLSAFGNDVSAELAYAQAAWGHGKRGDVLLGISTSGNAANVRSALVVGRATGMTTVGLTGRTGGKMAGLCDILLAVPADRTYEIQELHLPVYHCLCAMVEERFFP
ncbi:MAG TPA: SIS domain-containing protein [Spirochaetia bacterium]|nr:SIS domain-containing protein [Spirochaetia bacterium]